MIISTTIEEGVQIVRGAEIVTFTLDVSAVRPLGAVVTDPTMMVIRRRDGVDVTEEVLTGTMRVVGQVITLKRISMLEKGKSYRIHVRYMKGENQLETFFVVRCPSR